MKSCARLLLVLATVTAASVVFAGYFSFQSSAAVAQPQTSTEQALKAFAAMRPIDVHVHVFKTDPQFQALLEGLNLKLLNILVVDDTLSYRKELQPQIKDALALVRSSRGHIALCTTFDPYKFNDRSFDADTIKQLDQDFAEGAVAVKIWKNVGMEIKDRGGKFIMADNPRFAPSTATSPATARRSCRTSRNRTSRGDRLILLIPRGPITRKIRSGSCITSRDFPRSRRS